MTDTMIRPASAPSLVEELGNTFFFEECTEEQLQWIADHATVERIPTGTMIVSGEANPDAFWVLLSGEMQLSKRHEGQEITLERSIVPGTWAGWLPHFEREPSKITARAIRDSRFLRIAAREMHYVLANGFPVLRHLLSGLMSGTRNIVGAAVQQEKLAALGRLSAGLAHELNNPAAAAKRASRDLRDALLRRDQHAMVLIKALPVEIVSKNLGLIREVSTRDPLSLDPIERGDAEQEIIDWLDDHGVENSYDLGPSLLEASVTLADLEALGERVPAPLINDAVCWLEASVVADELSRTIEASVGRISELVAAIKEYTFMDREGQQEIDLHQGLDNTLLILNHELKQGVKVIRDYDPSIPRICAFGSELNQVWTNLIDNAVQAMKCHGKLTIRTRREDETAVVQITDNGPGIPQEILNRIFEPFFTTKGVGVGSGLGLDIARRIILHHDGSIFVSSEPGETTFSVRLPFGT